MNVYVTLNELKGLF